ncbi:hypothetical protein [Bacteroides sp.]|uniref:hypothetical protein n=1 Tax=Bacteroides sp. TaxID=29523 RepID=UPI0025C5D7F4|nr:hypothetical protein [Bacteroides sp.]
MALNENSREIIVKEIKNPPVKIFTPDNSLLCETENDLIFNDIRIQIMDKKLSGYYIEFNGERTDIKPDGTLDVWPKGLFDISVTQLNYLFGI